MNKRRAVIFDLDSTLCDTDHRREHLLEEVNGKWVKRKDPNWKGWEEGLVHDTPNWPVISIYEGAFASPRIDVVLCVTGRKEYERKATLNWFTEHGIPIPDMLFMRESTDKRPDTTVKEEIYRSKIEPHYDVLYVVEDRKRVVEMWRSLGLVCLQCVEGDY